MNINIQKKPQPPSPVGLSNPWWWAHHLQGRRHAMPPVTETVLVDIRTSNILKGSLLVGFFFYYLPQPSLPMEGQVSGKCSVTDLPLLLP